MNQAVKNIDTYTPTDSDCDVDTTAGLRDCDHEAHVSTKFYGPYLFSPVVVVCRPTVLCFCEHLFFECDRTAGGRAREICAWPIESPSPRDGSCSLTFCYGDSKETVSGLAVVSGFAASLEHERHAWNRGTRQCETPPQ
jgi:hypothetical protein